MSLKLGARCISQAASKEATNKILFNFVRESQPVVQVGARKMSRLAKVKYFTITHLKFAP